MAIRHGFSRFGPPTARERFHSKNRPAGTLSLLLPTILATLFLFTVVIMLNKASSLTGGGKVIRILNVDDVFPTEGDAERNRKKEFWEAPPPPSPEAVLAGGESEVPDLRERTVTADEWGWGSLEPPVRQIVPSTISGFAPPATRRASGSTLRTTSIPTPEIELPAVTPDTALPATAPRP